MSEQMLSTVYIVGPNEQTYVVSISKLQQWYATGRINADSWLAFSEKLPLQQLKCIPELMKKMPHLGTKGNSVVPVSNHPYKPTKVSALPSRPLKLPPPPRKRSVQDPSIEAMLRKVQEQFLFEERTKSCGKGSETDEQTDEQTEAENGPEGEDSQDWINSENDTARLGVETNQESQFKGIANKSSGVGLLHPMRNSPPPQNSFPGRKISIWQEFRTAENSKYYYNTESGEVRNESPETPALDKYLKQYHHSKYHWVRHPLEGFMPVRCIVDVEDGGNNNPAVVKVETIPEIGRTDPQELFIPKEMFSSAIEDASDLLHFPSDLIHLHSYQRESILYALHQRFLRNEIYSYIGQILVSINPFQDLPYYTPEFIELYKSSGSSLSLPPHVFGIASKCYDQLLRERKSQIIVISGESGAGKTEAAKLCLQFLAEVAESATGIERIVLASSALLEAFGNAKTIRNANSSRFGKFLELEIKCNGKLRNCAVTSYLLEKSRVVHVHPRERNFHIFYQLCAYMGRKGYFHLAESSSFTFLKSSAEKGTRADLNGQEEQGEEDHSMFEETLKAMSSIGISQLEQQEMFRVCSSILHLGNIEFQTACGGLNLLDCSATREQRNDNPNSQSSKCTITTSKPSSLSSFTKACDLLGCDGATLSRRLCERNLEIRGETMVLPMSVDQAKDKRDALAKELYSRLFNFLFKRINESFGLRCIDSEPVEQIEPSTESSLKIGLLDIFGFEAYTVNSFEQLCINYANEKLQAEFTECIFESVVRKCKEEGIAMDYVPYPTNSQVLKVLEGKPDGLFLLLDDEISIPKTTDETLLRKFIHHHEAKCSSTQNETSAASASAAGSAAAALFKLPKNHGKSRRKLVNSTSTCARRTKGEVNNTFILKHYAGEVLYSTDGFLLKNKDHLHEDLDTFLRVECSAFITEHLYEEKEELNRTTHAAVGSSPQHKSRQSLCLASKQSTLPRKNKKKSTSLGSKFRFQLKALTDKLRTSSVHYIRCIKPNDEQMNGFVNGNTILNQLNTVGLFEAITVQKNGFPFETTHEKFLNRYACLSRTTNGSENDTQKKSIASVIQHIHHIQRLRCSGSTSNVLLPFQLSETKVFWNVEQNQWLMRQMRARQELMAMRVQAFFKAIVVQNHVRMSLGVKDKLETALRNRDFNRIQRVILPQMNSLRVALPARIEMDLKHQIHQLEVVHSFQEQMKLIKSGAHTVDWGAIEVLLEQSEELVRYHTFLYEEFCCEVHSMRTEYETVRDVREAAKAAREELFVSSTSGNAPVTADLFLKVRVYCDLRTDSGVDVIEQAYVRFTEEEELLSAVVEFMRRSKVTTRRDMKTGKSLSLSEHRKLLYAMYEIRQREPIVLGSGAEDVIKVSSYMKKMSKEVEFLYLLRSTLQFIAWIPSSSGGFESEILGLLEVLSVLVEGVEVDECRSEREDCFNSLEGILRSEVRMAKEILRETRILKKKPRTKCGRKISLNNRDAIRDMRLWMHAWVKLRTEFGIELYASRKTHVEEMLQLFEREEMMVVDTESCLSLKDSQESKTSFLKLAAQYYEKQHVSFITEQANVVALMTTSLLELYETPPNSNNSTSEMVNDQDLYETLLPLENLSASSLHYLLMLVEAGRKDVQSRNSEEKMRKLMENLRLSMRRCSIATLQSGLYQLQIIENGQDETERSMLREETCVIQKVKGMIPILKAIQSICYQHEGLTPTTTVQLRGYLEQMKHYGTSASGSALLTKAYEVYNLAQNVLREEDEMALEHRRPKIKEWLEDCARVPLVTAISTELKHSLALPKEQFLQNQLQKAKRVGDAKKERIIGLSIKENFFFKCRDMFSLQNCALVNASLFNYRAGSSSSSRDVCGSTSSLVCFQFQTNPITISMTNMSSSKDVKKAVHLFKNLLGYIGVRHYSYPSMLAHEILRSGFEHSKFNTEIYCQLIKQLTKPASSSKDIGHFHAANEKCWKLFELCFNTFRPTEEIRNVVECFLWQEHKYFLVNKLYSGASSMTVQSDEKPSASVEREDTAQVPSLDAINLISNSSSSMRTSGYLNNTGFFGKRRWYVLERNVLRYFRHCKSKESLGFIDLTDLVEVQDKPSNGRKRRDLFYVELIGKEKTHTLLADSHSEQRKWLQAIHYTRTMFCAEPMDIA